MNLAPPLSRPAGRRPEEGAARPARRTPATSTAKSRGGTLQRERHQPDYTILVAVVSLASVGILMVYSSSAMRGYLSSANDTFAIVGPQIQWALLGLLAMVGMMRVDYRYLRLASVPFFVIAVILLVLVFVPSLNVGHRRLGALAAHRAAAGDPSRRDREARAHHLSRPLDGETRHAHPELLGRDGPVPDHRRCR